MGLLRTFPRGGVGILRGGCSRANGSGACTIPGDLKSVAILVDASGREEQPLRAASARNQQHGRSRSATKLSSLDPVDRAVASGLERTGRFVNRHPRSITSVVM